MGPYASSVSVAHGTREFYWKGSTPLAQRALLRGGRKGGTFHPPAQRAPCLRGGVENGVLCSHRKMFVVEPIELVPRVLPWLQLGPIPWKTCLFLSMSCKVFSLLKQPTTAPMPKHKLVPRCRRATPRSSGIPIKHVLHSLLDPQRGHHHWPLAGHYSSEGMPTTHMGSRV